MNISGWGNYPLIDAQVNTPNTHSSLQHLLSSGFIGIARGLGRSYGDSSLAENVVDSLYLDHLLEFNEETGELNCGAGISLSELLQIFIPRGWFLPVTPGTRFITVGGAIASDVHGKNHHQDGCFSEHVQSLQLAIANGEIVNCSRQENPELFYATCGGMGLTGIITSARFTLKRIGSAYIDATTIKTKNLADTFEQFEAQEGIPYSVAWIDCLARGQKLGRSLLMLGDHASDNDYKVAGDGKLTVPIDMPAFLLNHFTVSAFNTMYYGKQMRRITHARQHYEPFFYPLDSILNWNRIYGKPGFTQYQFVIPKAAGLEGMTTILKRIADSGQGSFLSVLKAFGPANDNYLSFPMEGYTLALDFKLQPSLFKLLDELDRIVLDYSGRIYLTKDVRMTEATFKQSYPGWQQFQEVRTRYGADNIFQSLQSKRLGI